MKRLMPKRFGIVLLQCSLNLNTKAAVPNMFEQKLKRLLICLTGLFFKMFSRYAPF